MLHFCKFRSIDMDGASMNHYEKQLYSVFKTFDIDNEEALDRPAVLELCDALQLEERGAALVDTLFERRADRVTFTQFRNGLLSVLGGEPAPPAPPAAPESAAPALAPASPPAAPPAPQPPALPSDEDSSGREVAPKFVFGAKKYGRRSRPQHPASDESPRHRVASDSRLDGERARLRMRCKRSASAMESRDGYSFTDDEGPVELDHDRRVDRERALALCRTLRMSDIDSRIVERVFDDSATDEITVGEFFDRLNSSLTSSIAASLEGASTNDSAPDDDAEVLPSDAVVEAWERAGVQRPRRLLVELGFSSAALRPPDLERALDDELRALGAAPDGPPDARALLLLAAHAAARLRSERARRRLDVAVAERDKLRADLAEANRRARLLAQDVDENHARIETELKASLRQLEARHAEALRSAAAEAAAERERAGAARAALERELARRSDAEARLRSDLSGLRDRNEELQSRAQAAEERARDAEGARARLAAEAAGALRGGAARAEAERRAAAELAAHRDELRADNQRLRDRCDELCAALEAAARARTAPPAPAASWRDEAATNVADAADQECDSSLASINPKVLSHNEALKRLQAIFENIQRISAPGNVNCESCSTLESTIAMIQDKIRELNENVEMEKLVGVEVGLQTEPNASEDVDSLKRDLANAIQRHNEDKENLSGVIKELESSLEQMKLEYDKCEEYWMCKLEEEREAFAEEQRAGDDRLADLVAKIGEYERQFAAPAALPTIDERRSLEAQFNDLEDEFVAYRREKEAELAAREQEATRLRERVEQLEQFEQLERVERAERVEPAGPPGAPPCAHLDDQLRRHARDAVRAGPAGAGGASAGAGGAGGAGCACGALAARWRAALGAHEAAALRARAARAERAAQRLHARLAAADLLVKDLYLENCRLAHLPRLPRLP